MNELKFSDSEKKYLASKIEASVIRSPCVDHPEMGDCWLWQKAIIKDGYGQTYLVRKAIRAHRASYAVYVGDIPKGLCILHKCDNPRCCNPSHLQLGTVDENVKDRVNKGRGAIGSRVGMSKLSDDDIPKILDLRRGGMILVDIAKIFGVSYTLVSMICRGRIWRHVRP